MHVRDRKYKKVGTKENRSFSATLGIRRRRQCGMGGGSGGWEGRIILKISLCGMVRGRPDREEGTKPYFTKFLGEESKGIDRRRGTMGRSLDMK